MHGYMIIAYVIGLSMLGLTLTICIDVLTNPVYYSKRKADRHEKAWAARAQKQVIYPNRHRRVAY